MSPDEKLRDAALALKNEIWLDNGNTDLTTLCAKHMAHFAVAMLGEAAKRAIVPCGDICARGVIYHEIRALAAQIGGDDGK